MSDDFDAILDQCLAEILAGRATSESCVRRYPAQADSLRALLPVAEQLYTLPPAAELSPATRHAIEARLLRQYVQRWPQAVKRSNGAKPKRWRGLIFALTPLVVCLVLVAVIIGAAGSSVPGAALYSVKRAAEQVRLALTPATQQAQLHLELAQQRLYEVRVLAEQGAVPQDLLSEMSSETSQIMAELATLPLEQQQALLTSLTNFQDQQVQTLERIASAAPDETQAALRATLADSTAKRKQAVELLASVRSKEKSVDPAKSPAPTLLIDETQPPVATPTTQPEATKPAAPQNTPHATKVPATSSSKPTAKLEQTPASKAKPATPQVSPKQPQPAKTHVPPEQTKAAPEPKPEKPTKPPKK